MGVGFRWVTLSRPVPVPALPVPTLPVPTLPIPALPIPALPIPGYLCYALVWISTKLHYPTLLPFFLLNCQCIHGVTRRCGGHAYAMVGRKVGKGMTQVCPCLENTLLSFVYNNPSACCFDCLFVPNKWQRYDFLNIETRVHADIQGSYLYRWLAPLNLYHVTAALKWLGWAIADNNTKSIPVYDISSLQQVEPSILFYLWCICRLNHLFLLFTGSRSASGQSSSGSCWRCLR